MSVFVVIACECLIGVYSTKEIADRVGVPSAVDRFGVPGTIEEIEIDENAERYL